MDYQVITYIAYLLISIPLTIWVAKTLETNGRYFLLEAFEHNEALADAINRLLVVGFYLINVGYVSQALKHHGNIETLSTSIEVLSAKVGWVLIVLGFMHFFNMFVFSRFRKKAELKNMAAPIAPSRTI